MRTTTIRNILTIAFSSLVAVATLVPPAFAQTYPYNSTQASHACPTSGPGVTCFGGQLYSSATSSCKSDPRPGANATQNFVCESAAFQCNTAIYPCGGCTAPSSVAGSACNNPIGGTYANQCGTCGCAIGSSLCAASNACVAVISCPQGTTFDPCTASCTTPNVLRNQVVAQSGYINIQGDIKSSAGDIYLANGKALRVDGSGTTTLSVGNWGGGGAGVNFSVNGNISTTGNLAVSGTGTHTVAGIFAPAALRLSVGAAAGRVLTSDASGNATWQAPSGGGGGLAGAGSVNRIAKFAAATTLGDSSIFDNGNIGIGDASPLALLTVGANNDAFRVTGAGDVSTIGTLNAANGALSVTQLLLNYDYGTLYVPASSNRVGINNVTPGFALDLTAGGVPNQAIVRIHDNNLSSSFTGLRMDRIGNSERWFLGMFGGDDTFRIRRNGASDALTISRTTGAVTLSSGVIIPTGAAVNRVLTSDASGNATWQTPPGGMGGTGSLGYVPKFTSAGSVGNSTIFEGVNGVGIGTASPTTRLDVAGTTRTVGLRVTGGVPGVGKVLTSDAIGNAAWQTFTASGVSGSGTAGRLPKLTAASTIGNSLVYDNGTNVGIGAAPLAYKLSVSGTLAAVSDIRSLTGDIYLANSKAIRIDGPGVTTLIVGNWGGGVTANLDVGGNVIGNDVIAKEGRLSLQGPTGGSVLVGEVAATGQQVLAVSAANQPAATLSMELNGDLRLVRSGVGYAGFSPPATFPGGNIVWTLPNTDGTAGQVLRTDGAKNLSWATAAATTAFMNNGNSFGASAVIGTNDAQSLALETNNTTRLTVSSAGKVGIGVAPDAADTLTVSGKATVTALRVNSGSPFAGKVLTGTDPLGNMTWAGPDVSSDVSVTPGRVPFFQTAANLMNSPLMVSGANIGLGTTTPGGLFSLAGAGLDGTALQQLAIYADTANGVLFDAPKNAAGTGQDVHFNWRGGGTDALRLFGANRAVQLNGGQLQTDGGSESVSFHLNEAVDGSYEWVGFNSGASRQGIMLWGGDWPGCRASGGAGDLCLRAESGNRLLLRADSYIEAKTGDGAFGLVVRDQDSDNWGNIDANDGVLAIGYNNNNGPLFVSNGAVGVDGSLGINGDMTLNGKVALRGNDQYLRLNQDGAFTAGTHTPGYLSSGSLNVGGAFEWAAPSFGNLLVAGEADLRAGNGTGVALRVNGTEALWSDGNTFSWGYGGTNNYFQDDIRTDGSLRVGSNNGLNVGIAVERNGTAMNLNNTAEGIDVTLAVAAWNGFQTNKYSLYGSNIVRGSAFENISSRRWKENVVDIGTPLEMIEKMNGVYFDWKKTSPTGQTGRDVGFIAEDMAEILPMGVGYDEDGRIAAFSYTKVVPVLVEGVKELNDKIKALESRIEELEEKR